MKALLPYSWYLELIETKTTPEINQVNTIEMETNVKVKPVLKKEESKTGWTIADLLGKQLNM